MNKARGFSSLLTFIIIMFLLGIGYLYYSYNAGISGNFISSLIPAKTYTGDEFYLQYPSTYQEDDSSQTSSAPYQLEPLVGFSEKPSDISSHALSSYVIQRATATQSFSLSDIQNANEVSASPTVSVDPSTILIDQQPAEEFKITDTSNQSIERVLTFEHLNNFYYIQFTGPDTDTNINLVINSFRFN
jgi:hypothetical protein